MPKRRSKSSRKFLTSALTVLVALVVTVIYLWPNQSSTGARADTGPSAKPSASKTTTAAPGSLSPGDPGFEERFVPTANDVFDATAALGTLKVRAANAKPSAKYDRKAQFQITPSVAWTDKATNVAMAGNSCDTRNDILGRDLTQIVRGEVSGCGKNGVTKGVLNDPYTGKVIKYTQGPRTSSEVQIDHIVALENVWASGGDKMTQAQRISIANDPRNLLAVDGPSNGGKSSSDASQWMPPNAKIHCFYVVNQIQIKKIYNLTITAAEKAAMTKYLGTCPKKR